jgi:ABC-type dipeptide/oligopeptide/nickel transport system ATPase subunit
MILAFWGEEESHFRRQKQRVSIARAIIKTPQSYFFDDCLSAVDTETEEAILNNLFEICKDKTTNCKSPNHAKTPIQLLSSKMVKSYNKVLITIDKSGRVLHPLY